jgi:hypothetical protein
LQLAGIGGLSRQTQSLKHKKNLKEIFILYCAGAVGTKTGWKRQFV